jgi:hypothetical protein
MGTELPIRDVCSSVAIGGIAEKHLLGLSFTGFGPEPDIGRSVAAGSLSRTRTASSRRSTLKRAARTAASVRRKDVARTLIDPMRLGNGDLAG